MSAMKSCFLSFLYHKNNYLLYFLIIINIVTFALLSLYFFHNSSIDNSKLWTAGKGRLFLVSWKSPFFLMLSLSFALTFIPSFLFFLIIVIIYSNKNETNQVQYTHIFIYHNNGISLCFNNFKLGPLSSLDISSLTAIQKQSSRSFL